MEKVTHVKEVTFPVVPEKEASPEMIQILPEEPLEVLYNVLYFIWQTVNLLIK